MKVCDTITDTSMERGLTMKKIKVGIIGTGFIGPAHIEALRRIPFLEVKALADIDEKTASEKAALLGVERAYGDYRDLLKSDDIEAVHICTPNFLHYSMVKAALLSKKHVICEKPLAMDSVEAKELISIAKEKNLANAVGFNLRYYPMVQQVKTMIKSDELGDIFAINGSYQQDWLLYETDYNWRIDPKMSGDSRAVADIGSHWIDMIEHITDLKIQKVCADFATFHKTRKKPLEEVETYTGKILKQEDYEEVSINTEDYASILLNFENNTHGSLTVNQAAAGRKNRIYFEIYGSKQSAVWSGEKPNELWIGSRDKANKILLKDPSLVSNEVRNYIGFPGGHNEGFPDTSKQFFKEYYMSILNNSFREEDCVKYPTFTDGYRELMVGEHIVESAKRRRWVETKGI